MASTPELTTVTKHDMLHAHLNDKFISEDLWKNNCYSEHLLAIRKTNGRSVDRLYQRVCDLLNFLSRRIREYAISRKIIDDSQEPMVFLDYHDMRPTHRLSDEKLGPTPQIIGLAMAEKRPRRSNVRSRSKPSPVSYYRVETIAECFLKTSGDNTPNQILDFTEQLLEARPDKPSVYTLSVCQYGYRVVWCDCLNQEASDWQSWDDLELLSSYLYTLYDPRKEFNSSKSDATHLQEDPTCSLGNIDENGNPRYEIGFSYYNERGELMEMNFDDCQLIFQGTVWGKRTTVWHDCSGDHQNTDFVVIKDSYQLCGDLMEGEMLDEIHNHGLFPGVVRHLGDWEIKFLEKGGDCTIQSRSGQDELEGRDQQCEERSKRRLVLLSMGSSMDEARTVKDLLMALYDTLEVHGALVQVGYMHRDVTPWNALMYPRHSSIQGKVTNEIPKKDQPKFIGKILSLLNTTDDEAHGDEDAPRCLLIDLDTMVDLYATGEPRHDGASTSAGPNPGATLKTEGNEPGMVPAREPEHHGSTSVRQLGAGTPRFAARSVARQKTRPKDRNYVPMPELKGKAKDLYVSTFGEDTYNSRCDQDGQFHGGTAPKGLLFLKQFLHKPEHDAESVFWMLLYFCMRALPKGCDSDPQWGKAASQKWEKFDGHEFNQYINKDVRDVFFKMSVKQYEDILHSELKPLGKLLYDMSKQVFPDYSYLDPVPRDDHLHEALRRLLLQFIVDMEDPIELTPGKTRKKAAKQLKQKEVAIPPICLLPAGPSPNKRKRGVQLEEGPKKKRARHA